MLTVGHPKGSYSEPCKIVLVSPWNASNNTKLRHSSCSIILFLVEPAQ